jgi:hypothetical protein
VREFSALKERVSALAQETPDKFDKMLKSATAGWLFTASGIEPTMGQSLSDDLQQKVLENLLLNPGERRRYRHDPTAKSAHVPYTQTQ